MTEIRGIKFESMFAGKRSLKPGNKISPFSKTMKILFLIRKGDSPAVPGGQGTQ